MGTKRRATGQLTGNWKPQKAPVETHTARYETQDELRADYEAQHTEKGARKLQGKREMLEALKAQGIKGSTGEVRVMYNNVTGAPSFYRERN